MTNFRITWVLLVIACVALGYGLYEIIAHGVQVSEQREAQWRLWTGAGGVSLALLTGKKVTDKTWRKMITGLSTEKLPSKTDIDKLRKASNSPAGKWIADVSEGYWQSGFCYSKVGKVTNSVTLVSGVVSSGIFIGSLPWVAGALGIAGIATGGISMLGMLGELLSQKRFKYWLEKGEQIRTRWETYRTSVSTGITP